MNFTSPAAETRVGSAGISAVTFSGNCSASGQAVTLSVSDIDRASATCTDGSWSVSFSLSTYPEGAVIIRATHSSGGTSATATLTLIKDTVAPTVTLSAAAYINLASKAGFALNGSCSEEGRPVTVSAGGVTASPSCTGGAWSTSLNLSLVSDGTLSLHAEHADTAGNVASTGTSSIKDTIAPSAPATIDDGSWWAYPTKSPLISWSPVTDASAYQVMLGTTQGGSDLGSSQVTVAYANFTGLTLTEGMKYYASVKAVDAAGNASSLRLGDGWLASACPENFTTVPLNGNFSFTPFCVSRFEMKIEGIEDGSLGPSYLSLKPQSRASGTPWVNISRDNAISRCQAMGSGFNLISNTQWQIVAHHLENVPLNWTSGGIGSAGIYRGHSDATPASSLAVTSEADPYNGTSNSSGQTTGAGKEQRRTLTLSTNATLWDFSGNVAEWLRDSAPVLYGTSSPISQITTASHTAMGPDLRSAKGKFGPFGNFSNLNFGDYGGLGFAYLSVQGNALHRGGGFSDGTQAGLYSVNTTVSPTTATPQIGFRCVYELPILNPPTAAVSPSGTVTFTAQGGSGSYSFSVVNGGTFNSGSGLFTAPAAAGTVGLKVTDSRGSSYTAPVIVCPASYVPVPGDIGTAGSSPISFCAAKFEAKRNADLNRADSVAANLPWTGVTRDQAKLACQANGVPNYDLISNAQWQTIARNAESVANNWIGGVAGAGALFQGHSDYSPLSVLSVTNEADPYDSTQNIFESAAEQRRTLHLSNGETLWDFSGNAVEWVSDDNSVAYGYDASLSAVTSATHTATAADGLVTKAKFGGLTDFPDGASNTHGLGFGYLSGSNGTILRGGGFQSGTYAGVFAV
ncbi:MAG: hypothetical protein NDJ90_05665, partial [Oligoflexia bacterium]|nr:hypothetical protein [Oligoflexia bacterium]